MSIIFYIESFYVLAMAGCHILEQFLFIVVQARKFLPYGFGPGGKTVIEDAASFNDDEEDYGDFQVSTFIISSSHKRQILNLPQ